MASSRVFSWLQAPTNTFTFKTQIRLSVLVGTKCFWHCETSNFAKVCVNLYNLHCLDNPEYVEYHVSVRPLLDGVPAPPAAPPAPPPPRPAHAPQRRGHRPPGARHGAVILTLAVSSLQPAKISFNNSKIFRIILTTLRLPAANITQYNRMLRSLR